jgi:methylmalonyl-CoA mutase, C-terminal domain
MNELKTQRPLAGKRILVGKPGLDGHDIGAKIVALTLRDAGAEVIYTGLRRTPLQIAQVAVDEGVDAVGLSILSGSHKELVADVIAQLRALKAGNVKVFVGGWVSRRCSRRICRWTRSSLNWRTNCHERSTLRHQDHRSWPHVGRTVLWPATG